MLALPLRVDAQNNRAEIPYFLTDTDDAVPAEVRTARSKIFDNAPPGAPPMVMQVDLSPQRELASDASDAVVIGTVAGRQPFLTFSGKSIYTEYTILISSAVKTPGGGSPQILSVLRPGGAGRLRNGREIELRVFGQGDELQNGERYLLFLRHHKNASAYSLFKVWRIGSETLQAAFLDRKATNAAGSPDTDNRQKPSSELP